jgi:hypothetical protein
MPLKKWSKACANANPNLYFRVFGKKAGTTKGELSVVSPVQVK